MLLLLTNTNTPNTTPTPTPTPTPAGLVLHGVCDRADVPSAARRVEIEGEDDKARTEVRLSPLSSRSPSPSPSFSFSIYLSPFSLFVLNSTN